MRRWVIALCTVVLMVACLLPMMAGAQTSGRVAANDAMTSYRVQDMSGELMVSTDLFQQYFGASVRYDGVGGRMLTISKGARALFYDIDAGTVQDSGGQVYSHAAYIQNGGFLVPIQFTARYLGLGYSYIDSSMVRVTDSRATLTDSQISRMYAENTSSVAPSVPSSSSSSGETTTPPETSELEEEEPVERRLYLTFTNSPGTYTKGILDVLAQTRARGTFFVTPEGMREYPDLVVRMAAEGHTIGISVTGEQVLNDVAQCQAYLEECDLLLRRLVKQSSFIVRTEGAVSAEVQQLLVQQGYRVWGAHLDAADNDGRSAYTVAERLLKATEKSNGATVILFHGGYSTASALSRVLRTEQGPVYVLPIRYDIDPLV